jgi:hypothetical protein
MKDSYVVGVNLFAFAPTGTWNSFRLDPIEARVRQLITSTSSGIPVGRIIGFRAAGANNQVVTAENAGASPLIANRGAVGPWERFYVEDRGGGYVALKAMVNNRYVCADNGGASSLIANRTGVGQWETFKWVDLGNGNFGLIAQANGRYVTAESGGSQPLIANRTGLGAWETFRWENAP